MKKFAVQHLYFSGFLVFIIVTSLGLGLGFLVIKWRNYEGLGAGYFAVGTMMVSLLSGVFSGLFAALFLEKKRDRLA